MLMKPRGAGAGRVIGQQISGVEALAREFSCCTLVEKSVFIMLSACFSLASCPEMKAAVTQLNLRDFAMPHLEAKPNPRQNVSTEGNFTSALVMQTHALIRVCVCVCSCVVVIIMSKTNCKCIKVL